MAKRWEKIQCYVNNTTTLISYVDTEQVKNLPYQEPLLNDSNSKIWMFILYIGAGV